MRKIVGEKMKILFGIGITVAAVSFMIGNYVIVSSIHNAFKEEKK